MSERAASERPPSPLPPSPRTSRHGWRPAEDDLSLEAIDWRSRTALRRADRGLDSIADLRKAVDTLTATITTADTTINLWAGRAGKALGALALAALLGAARIFWLWASTLHH